MFTWLNVDCPETFKVNDNLDEPEHNKLLKLVLSFKLVVVLPKLLIDNKVEVEKVDVST